MFFHQVDQTAEDALMNWVGIICRCCSLGSTPVHSLWLIPGVKGQTCDMQDVPAMKNPVKKSTFDTITVIWNAQLSRHVRNHRAQMVAGAKTQNFREEAWKRESQRGEEQKGNGGDEPQMFARQRMRRLQQLLGNHICVSTWTTSCSAIMCEQPGAHGQKLHWCRFDSVS